jgi:predicted nucleic acid-binding Zn ribbon protein
MSFDHLDKILQALTRQPGWESYRQYCLVVNRWQEVLAPRLLEQTRPFSLSRGVLSVATCSATLAQELSLQRYSLLKKMNRFLEEPIEDIHFSSARWHERSIEPPPETIAPLPLTEHPSYVKRGDENVSSSSPPSSPVNKRDSFERWQEKIRQRSRSWPICPCCQSPTPSGEIDRWGCCAYCAVRDWTGKG